MSSSLTTQIFRIANMSCVNCENIIEQTLMKTRGIAKVFVSYSRGLAEITYDEVIIQRDKIVEVLKNAGYYVNEDNQPPVSTKSTETARKLNYTDLLSYGIIFFALYLIAKRLGLLDILASFPVAKEGMGYGMIFLIGILTSVHCLAMCGGICLSQCVPKKKAEERNRFSAMTPSLLYNLGRVISYTVIGGIVGAVGSVFSFSSMLKGIVQIIAGVFMVIMGLNMLHIFPWLRSLNPRMPKLFAKIIYTSSTSKSPFYIGVLNGFMPCGPLQAMQIYALSTGSPLKGAFSMFLFSLGTFPLMFTFGALSSFLSKKFASKMMTASAVLVVFLGVLMFNYGLGLWGFQLPSFRVNTTSEGTKNMAVLEGNVQVITTGLSSGSYEPIVVQKGIPVRWIIKAEKGDLNGCNNSIIIPKLGIRKNLELGDNLIEFTAQESGTITFSCWMGMIRSKITVVDELDQFKLQD